MLVHKFSQAKMNSFLIICGWSFYIFLCLSQIAENLNNRPSFMNASIGLPLFAVGSFIQNRSHIILAQLRSSSPKRSHVQDHYLLPRGFLFEFVTCPHYFAELLIYVSFLFLTNGVSFFAWLAFTFVVINLTDGALKTHKYYQQKFDNYPKNRFAIIPFLL